MRYPEMKTNRTAVDSCVWLSRESNYQCHDVVVCALVTISYRLGSIVPPGTLHCLGVRVVITATSGLPHVVANPRRARGLNYTCG